MFQVYHARDNQYGTVFIGRKGQPDYVRWNCGYWERYYPGGWIKEVGQRPTEEEEERYAA